MFYKYVIYFFIYAFMGWFMEVCITAIREHKFVNRGFLIGPICPIYGNGVLLILLLIGDNKSDVLGVFLKSVLICSVLEYFTSYIMEKLFKIRWWDYSQKKFNLNGRICLDVMIGFGILCLLMIYVVHPAIVGVIDKIPFNITMIVSIVLLVLYIIDNVISCYLLLKIKGKIKSNEKKDSTEKIKKQIEKWIESNSVLYRRIRQAFPKFEVFRKINPKKKKQKE